MQPDGVGHVGDDGPSHDARHGPLGGPWRQLPDRPQRFCAQALPWARLFWVFFRQHLSRADAVSLLVGDEGVVTKAGKRTYGLDRCFASLYGTPVPGLACFTLSLVSVQARRSLPRRGEQVVRSAAEKAASKATADAKKQKPSTAKRRPGRPKGSKNPPKADGTRPPEFCRLTGRLDALLHLIAGVVSVRSVVLDGHCGHHNALQRAQQSNLHLMSKLRCDAALSFPSVGPYAGRGPRRTDGDKVDDDNLPEPDCQETTVEGHIQTRLSQRQLLHKECVQPVHVVIIAQTHLRTQARAHVVLFSSDLARAYAPLVDYDGLRCQIECNFLDTKKYWVLEDFMNITPTGITNAAHLSLFMVHVAYRLCTEVRQRAPDSSVLDVKADCRGSKYVEETIKMLPEKPEPILFAKILNQVAGLGRIHATQPSCSFS